ncbi:MAG: CaiB/BaiF CoA transferase family protein [Novosphingobium sp.]
MGDARGPDIEPAGENGKPLPLAGIRVVDFSMMVSGPLAGQMLGDLGAEVIKVEPPGGDPLRFVRPFHKGVGSFFLHTNRHKRSIELNMKADEGRQLALKLVNTADVVLENFRPGVMERLGLGYETLKKSNPGLIYAAISGFGQSGPYVSRPAYDHVIQGMTGAMLVPGYGDVPTPIHNVIVDKAASMATVNGILAALLGRLNGDGEGQRVDISLLNSFAAFGLPEMMANVTFLEPGSDKRDPVGIYHPVKTKDGWVIGHVQTDNQFRAACKIFNREDLIGDPRFTTMRDRARAIDKMWAEFAVNATEIETDELVSAAEEASLPLGPINTVEDFIADPQAEHNKAHFIFDDPQIGPVRLLTHPAKLSETPARVAARAPILGEHSPEIAAAVGVDDAQFRKLVEAGVIGSTDAP